MYRDASRGRLAKTQDAIFRTSDKKCTLRRDIHAWDLDPERNEESSENQVEMVSWSSGYITLAMVVFRPVP